MGWFNRKSAATSVVAASQPWLVKVFGGGKTAAGVHVSPETALQIGAVFACIRLLSESVAGLPLILYRRDGNRKERATDHPLYRLLHDAPNDVITSYEFREMLQGHLGLRGNAYALIERDNKGNVVALIPLLTTKVTPKVDATGEQMFYDVQGVGDNIPARRILHLRGFTLDGYVGVSPIAYARETLGISLAAEKFSAQVFESDATPPGVLEVSGNLKPDHVSALRESWNEQHRNKREIAILHSGMKYQKIGLSGADIQYIETRKLQVTEIARLYRVPPHMIADLDKATFSNIEQQSIDFVTHTLRPWLVRWEQRLNKALLLPEEQEEYFFEFLVEGLLRGDQQSRYRAYAIGRQWGWLSPNDVRERENMNPIEGGDTYHEPLNMQPLGTEKDDASSPAD